MGFRRDYVAAALRTGRSGWDLWQSAGSVAVIVSLAAINTGIALDAWESAAWTDLVNQVGSWTLAALLVWLAFLEVPARMWRDAPRAEAAVSPRGARWVARCEALGQGVGFRITALDSDHVDRVYCVVEAPDGCSYREDNEGRAALATKRGAEFWTQYPHRFPGAPAPPDSGSYRVTWCGERNSIEVERLAIADFHLTFTDQEAST